jgi:hypothetical protein
LQHSLKSNDNKATVAFFFFFFVPAQKAMATLLPSLSFFILLQCSKKGDDNFTAIAFFFSYSTAKKAMPSPSSNLV